MDMVELQNSDTLFQIIIEHAEVGLFEASNEVPIPVFDGHR